MMNLINIANIIKKFRWLILVFAILLFIFIIILLIVFLAKPEEIVPKPIEKPRFEALPGKASQFNTQNLIPPQNIPQTLPTYTLQPVNLLANAQELADKLRFSLPPRNLSDINLGAGLAFSGNEATLIIYSNNINYAKIITKPPVGKPNVETAKRKAVEFLSNLGLSFDPSAEPQITYSYLPGEDILETKDPNLANFVNLNFPDRLSGLPVISALGGISISLDSQQNVIRFTYQQLVTRQLPEQYPIIGFNRALESLKAGNATVIQVTGEREDVSSLTQLINVILNNVYLAYYLPSQTSATIQPVWIFEGSSVINNLTIDVTLAVPAIGAS